MDKRAAKLKKELDLRDAEVRRLTVEVRKKRKELEATRRSPNDSKSYTKRRSVFG